MIITNKTNVPEFIFRALAKDNYSRGESEYSISDLINPPQVRLLKKLHDKEIEEDVQEKIASFIGTAVHEKIERAALAEKILKPGSIFEIQEQRFFTEMFGVIISGQIDCYDSPRNHLYDVKVTKSSKICWGEYTEWEQQLNCYAFLLSLLKYKVDHITICAFIKDWDEKQKLTNVKYPKFELTLIPLRVANLIKVKEYLEKRVQKHIEADTSGKVAECTEKERWKNNLRCTKYCKAAKWCPQYAKIISKIESIKQCPKT